MNMESDRPLVTPKELISPDAGSKENWDIFDNMLEQVGQLIKLGQIK